MGYKFHLKNDLKNSLKEILKPLKRASNKTVLKLSLRKIAINIIEILKNEEYREKNIYDIYTELKQKISTEYNFEIGSALQTGYAKTFYENHTINDILPYVKVDTKSDDLVRTIHSAKGTEFKNTLVHFESITDFRKYILNSADHIDSEKDDCRIYYVACSRAMENLYINIPEATQNDIERIDYRISKLTSDALWIEDNHINDYQFQKE